jgi:DNA-binding protein HU-beta
VSEKEGKYIMLKQDVINAMQEKLGGSKKDAREALEAFESVVVESLKGGEDVALKGFVTFSSKEVAEGKGRNPQTGEAVVVPAHRKASVKLAKGLRKF